MSNKTKQKRRAVFDNISLCIMRFAPVHFQNLIPVKIKKIFSIPACYLFSPYIFCDKKNYSDSSKLGSSCCRAYWSEFCYWEKNI